MCRFIVMTSSNRQKKTELMSAILIMYSSSVPLMAHLDLCTLQLSPLYHCEEDIEEGSRNKCIGGMAGAWVIVFGLCSVQARPLERAAPSRLTREPKAS